MARRLAGLFFVLALSACSPESGKQVVQLDCRGARAVDGQPPVRAERLYRIDLQGAALDDWNVEARRFVRWGSGRLVQGDAVTFVGEVRVMDRRVLVRRQLRYDRSTRKIRDQVEASWGGVMAFEGTCEER